jgi:hypothetical protein
LAGGSGKNLSASALALQSYASAVTCPDESLNAGSVDGAGGKKLRTLAYLSKLHI